MSQSVCAYLAGRFPSVSTVRVSAAGQPLGACTCNFAMGMRTSAGPYSTSCRWPQRQKKNGTRIGSKTVAGKERRDGRAFCASVCTIHFACGISKRYFAPREAAERGRVDSLASIPWPAPRASTLVLCRQRTRWQHVRGRRRF